MISLQRTFFGPILLLSALLLLNSCASTITSTLVAPALENMQAQTDLDLVCEGTPSYLLMIDSFIASDPDDTSLLLLGTKAYSGYIGAMMECGSEKERIKTMAEKARLYSSALLSETLSIRPEDDFETFKKKLNRSSKTNVDKIFWATFGLVSWIQQQEGAPAAMAEIGKMELLLEKIIELDETIENGMAHFLLGGYYGTRPKALGGNPEKSKIHFQRALEISDRKILIYQTVFAEIYGRNTLDKELHNSLLEEVIQFPLQSNKQNMLANQIAKRRAQRLFEEEYFED